MINCPSCTAEQANTSKFCSACGAALRPDIEATVAHEPASGASGSSVRSSFSDSSHHGRFLPGTRVADRYRIVSLVGKGGMGEVYRADDLKLGHTVALKFLPKELADDPQRLEYFHNEVRLTRQVSHPNVCRVYDIGEVDGQHFLSMEYIGGDHLKILLRRIGLLVATQYMLLVRFGFLVIVVQMTVQTLATNFPLTLDTNHWYFGHGLFAVGWISAMALYGFYTSLGNRSVFGTSDAKAV